MFRFDRFFLDEKDLFVFGLGVFLLFAWIFKMSVFPFRFSSLLVVFLFLIFTRSKIPYQRFDGYLYLSLIGLVLSLVFSPYSVGLFLFLSFVLMTKYS